MIEEQEARELEETAHRLAAYVKRTQRSVRLFGASPPMRKVMHGAFNIAEAVASSSAGFGLFRHLQVVPNDENKTEPETTQPTD